MSVNYPISPRIVECAQSINHAKLVLPQKKRGCPCHFLIIRLPHRWVVWLRQLVVMKKQWTRLGSKFVQFIPALGRNEILLNFAPRWFDEEVNDWNKLISRIVSANKAVLQGILALTFFLFSICANKVIVLQCTWRLFWVSLSAFNRNSNEFASLL